MPRSIRNLIPNRNPPLGVVGNCAEPFCTATIKPVKDRCTCGYHLCEKHRTIKITIEHKAIHEKLRISIG